MPPISSWRVSINTVKAADYRPKYFISLPSAHPYSFVRMPPTPHALSFSLRRRRQPPDKTAAASSVPYVVASSCMRRHTYCNTSSSAIKQCLNCAQTGHVYRECPYPHTSYGVILFRQVMSTDTSSIRSHPHVEYLLICRRHTFGYVECVRANFELTDRAYTRQLLCEMTIDERRKITEMPFKKLWADLWQDETQAATGIVQRYYHEYNRAKTRFHTLRTSAMFQRLLTCLPKSVWTSPEWGFPKGKRNRNESPQACALREMAEETGLSSKHAYNRLGKQQGFGEPIVEAFRGTDGQLYRHVYYIAEYLSHPHHDETEATNPSSTTHRSFDNDTHPQQHTLPPPTSIPRIDPTNPQQTREVSAIDWCTYDECMARIRSYNTAKRTMLTNVVHPRVCAYVFQRYSACAPQRCFNSNQSSAHPPNAAHQGTDEGSERHNEPTSAHG